MSFDHFELLQMWNINKIAIQFIFPDSKGVFVEIEDKRESKSKSKCYK